MIAVNTISIVPLQFVVFNGSLKSILCVPAILAGKAFSKANLFDSTYFAAGIAGSKGC